MNSLPSPRAFFTTIFSPMPSTRALAIGNPGPYPAATGSNLCRYFTCWQFHPFEAGSSQILRVCAGVQGRNQCKSQILSFMGKSRDTPQLAVGMNGMWGFGGSSPHFGFFLGRYPTACCGVLHFWNRFCQVSWDRRS